MSPIEPLTDLVDPSGRVVEDLRISVTDRCDVSCTSGMPDEGMQRLPRREILSFGEIERLARIWVQRYGFAVTTDASTLRHCTHDIEAAGVERIDNSFGLRAALRNGETDDEIAQRIERAVGTSWAGHQINRMTFVRPVRSTSQIGV